MGNRTWISTDEAGGLLGVSARTLQRHISAGRYTSRQVAPVRGKKRLEIRLDSLPAEARAKWKSDRLKAAFRKHEKELSQLTEKQREVAFKRFEKLKEWEGFAKQKKLSMFKAGWAYAESIGGRPSRGTLERWRQAFTQGGVAALAPGWKNARKRHGEQTISPEAKQMLLDLWLVPSRPTVLRSFELMERWAAANGYKAGSYTTAKAICSEVPKPVKDMHRYGETTFRDKSEPQQIRDYTSLRVMQRVVADHHLADVFIIWPDGSIGRPWISAWEDMRSRKIVGHVIVSQPSGDSISLALCNVLERYGLFEEAYLDNGKDFRGKFFTGQGKKKRLKRDFDINYDVDFMDGVYRELGIKPSFTKPYMGKSKNVEPWFRTLATGLFKFLQGYCGEHALNKPEVLAAQIKNRELLTLQQFKELVSNWIDEYNSVRTHSGDGMEKRTPDAVFFEHFQEHKMRKVRPKELAMLFMSYPTALTVGQNGIWFNDMQDYYLNPELQLEWMGRKVAVRYHMDNPDRIYVFSPEGKFLGIADKKSKAKFGQDADAYKAHQRHVQTLKEATGKWVEDEVGERLTPIERARMAGAGVSVEEPVVEAEYVHTRYRHIVAWEENQKEQKRERKQALEKFDEIYKSDFVPPDTGDTEHVEQFMIEYGRFS